MLAPKCSDAAIPQRATRSRTHWRLRATWHRSSMGGRGGRSSSGRPQTTRSSSLGAGERPSGVVHHDDPNHLGGDSRRLQAREEVRQEEVVASAAVRAEVRTLAHVMGEQYLVRMALLEE